MRKAGALPIYALPVTNKFWLSVQSSVMVVKLRRWCSTLMLLALVGTAPLYAFSSDALTDFTHRAWHVQDGLPDQVVQAIAQTPDHYLWIGTTKGLLRFDGRTFMSYTSRGAKVLRHGVTVLMVSRDGTLYIGTEGGGLLRLHAGLMQQFGATDGIANPLVRALFEDNAGTLWVGTDGGIFRSLGRRFVRVESLAQFPNLGSAALLQDRAGDIWSGGSQLLRFHGNQMNQYVLPLQNGSMRIKAICEGDDGSIWVGAVAGLFHQMPDGNFVKIKEVQGSVRTLGRMLAGQVWAGTVGNGLYLQHGNHFDHVRAPGVLPSNTILSETQDGDGNIWLGTQAGLLRLSRSGMRLTMLPNAPDSDFGTVMRDSDGTLWICSSQLFRMRNGQTERYHFPGLGYITVRAMLRERNGALWLGTTGRGAYRIVPGKPTAHYTTEIGTNYIRGFFQSPDGSVWIGTDGGVSHFHNGVIDNYHEVLHAPRTLTLALAEDRNKRMWIGTQRGLATLYKGVYENLPVAESFHEQAVWSLLADPDGTLWIGSDSGLYRLRNRCLVHLSLDPETYTPAVYQILEDASGMMWIGGPTRVLRMPRQALNQIADGSTASIAEPELFAVSTEIQGAELYGGMQPAGILDADGTAWFPTSQGPLHLIPRQRRSIKDVPLVIDRVLVDGESVNPTSSLDLPAGTRTLEIDYAPVLLSSQMGLHFRQRLKGFDNWSAPSFSRTAIYTNLPAGRYRFLAQARYGQSGQISTVELSILQRAFFYRKPWFWAICLLCIIGAIWSIYRLRVHQIKMRFSTITTERNRLAREIHDTVIQGCTAVSALLEAFSSVNPTAKPGGDLLDVAKEQIRTTIGDARNAVWNLRSHESGDHNLASSLPKLLDQCLRNTGVTSTFHVAGVESSLDYTIAHELLMTIREALLNAVAHSTATRIDLGLKCSAAELTISVADNGKGFNVADADAVSDHHYGLTGMRERIENIGGVFHLSTKIDAGTKLTFQIPRDTLGRRRHIQLEE